MMISRADLVQKTEPSFLATSFQPPANRIACRSMEWRILKVSADFANAVFKLIFDSQVFQVRCLEPNSSSERLPAFHEG